MKMKSLERNSKNMNRISTNLKQSRKLLELGLDPRTADIAYIKHCTSDNPEWRYDTEVPMVGQPIGVDYLPSWSLGALRKQIPVGIKVQDKIELFTCHNRIDGTWVYSFGDYIQFTGLDIDAAYKTVAWLLKKDET